jgi:tRNA threonylcarbamoyladenosine biosynthesis protein TsaE
MNRTAQNPWTETLTLAGEAKTIALARDLRHSFGAGDVLLLAGPVGAGKSLFARAVIQGLLADFDTLEDVPSPTFTLVQTYRAGKLDIWHSDLYRLGGVDEVDELGLFAAFETAFCLVEWPDRLQTQQPGDALTLELGLCADPGVRLLRASARAGKFDWVRRVLRQFSTDKVAANG